MYLADRGWQVTAVDGSAEAIRILRRRAEERGLTIATVVADLEQHEFTIEPQAWDLIVVGYYLQRDLLPAIRAGVRWGGTAIVIVHVTEGNQQPSPVRVAPGELRAYFDDWEILHSFEGEPTDPEHKRPVAEIVARRSPLVPMPS